MLFSVLKPSNNEISALRLPSKAHLRRVNCAFSGFAGLEIPFFREFREFREIKEFREFRDVRSINR